ncbi:MAG: flavodoxin domain-containing protein [Pseudomonadota bacterium]
MSNILIIYASDYGNTKKMADAVMAGASSVDGAKVTVKAAEAVTAEDMLAADAVIAGTPVHMGAMDWRIKKFIDTVCGGLWMENKMVGKVAAVFATGSGFGNAGGGAELTMLSLINNFVELGMVFVPLPKSTPGYAVGGLQWGPYGRSAGVNLEQTGVAEESLEAAQHHGRHVARVAAVIAKENPFVS